MSSIPLVALNVKPQGNSPLETYAQMMQMQGMKQNQQMQQEQLQGARMENQQRETAMRDQQTVMQVLGQTGGDMDKALPMLSGKVSPQTLMGLQKAHLETRKTLAEISDKELAAKKYQNDQYVQLLSDAKALPPEQYTQAWPNIAAAANQIHPEHPLDPSTPIPQQNLNTIGLGLMTSEQYLKQEEAKRAQATLAETQRHNLATEANQKKNVTEAQLAMQAAGGDETSTKAIKILDESKRNSRPVVNVTASGTNDIKDAADAIEKGMAPPVLTEYSFRDRTKLAAELNRRGYNMAKAEMDYKAVQKQMSTLNGPQQTRLRQSIQSADEMLTKVEDLYAQWKQLAPQSGFKVLNKATLATMKQMPGRAGAVAQALDAQIADLTADLGNIYMGGNSPTDHALSLASKSLSADWNDATFQEGVKQARANVRIRYNSIMNTQPAGVGADSPYLPQKPQQPQTNNGGIDYSKYKKIGG